MSKWLVAGGILGAVAEAIVIIIALQEVLL